MAPNVLFARRASNGQSTEKSGAEALNTTCPAGVIEHGRLRGARLLQICHVVTELTYDCQRQAQKILALILMPVCAGIDVPIGSLSLRNPVCKLLRNSTAMCDLFQPLVIRDQGLPQLWEFKDSFSHMGEVMMLQENTSELFKLHSRWRWA